ncbi:MAG: alanine racemase [Candidatus Omnitrophota bacterium]|nr:alanine racemase [Candidatus Omnitrophota bacterium]
MEKSRAWAEIDIAAIRANLNAIRKIVAPARVLACVKANAYGLGASTIAPFVEKDAGMFGVAIVSEGVELRRVGIKKRILVLGLAPEEEFEDGLKNGLEFTVADRKSVRKISALALRLKKEAAVHLKVDTGMGRLGVNSKELPQFYCWCRNLPGIRISGIFTHFPVAETRNDFTLKQIETFREVTTPLTLPLPAGERDKRMVSHFGGEGRVVRHAANSAAVFNYPESYFDLVRVGLALYGSFPFSPTGSPYKSLLKPVVTLGGRIVFRKEIDRGETISYGRIFQAKKKTRVATVSVGYADGYGRNLSRKASVLIAGKRCPVIGNICMDMTMVDISEVGAAVVGDEVILIGCQRKEEIRVEEVAGWASTVPHEILSRIGSRVNRIYKH